MRRFLCSLTFGAGFAAFIGAFVAVVGGSPIVFGPWGYVISTAVCLLLFAFVDSLG